MVAIRRAFTEQENISRVQAVTKYIRENTMTDLLTAERSTVDVLLVNSRTMADCLAEILGIVQNTSQDISLDEICLQVEAIILEQIDTIKDHTPNIEILKVPDVKPIQVISLFGATDILCSPS